MKLKLSISRLTEWPWKLLADGERRGISNHVPACSVVLVRLDNSKKGSHGRRGGGGRGRGRGPCHGARTESIVDHGSLM